VSKHHRQARKPKPADWVVTDLAGSPTQIDGATFSRDARGGYTFTDRQGICADFPPGMVLRVTRKDAPLTVADVLRPQDEVLDSRA
jgi:hypothetical protein